MAKTCPHCRQENVSPARFCAHCGKPIGDQITGFRNEIQTPKVKKRGGCGFLCVLGMLCAGSAGLFLLAKNDARCWAPFYRVTVSRSFPLAADKAEAMFDLLKPSNVSVLVGPTYRGQFISGRGLDVEGTREEIRTVERFLGLLTSASDEYERSWRPRYAHTCGLKIDRRYRLGRQKAKALERILSFEAVPVSAYRSRSKLKITATPEDHEVIHAIVKILGGRQYKRR